MDKLVRIIGEAPSEMPLEELRIKLLNERERVRRGLDYFKNVTLRKGKGRKKAAKSTQLNALMAEAGLTPAQFLKGIELLKQQKASPESEGDK